MTDNLKTWPDISCDEARVEIGADPARAALADRENANSALAQHIRGCADCRNYRHEIARVESDLLPAMRFPVTMAAVSAPASNVVSIDSHAPAATHATHSAAATAVVSRWQRWALAASVLLISGLAVVLFALKPSNALAKAVVSHVAQEQSSWTETVIVPQSALDQVLKRSGVRLDPQLAPDVVYAHSCWFRGRNVPHLVVRTPHGASTVLVLAGERVTERQEFSEDGYSGELLPAPNGSIAILTRSAPADAHEQMVEVERRVMPALTMPAAP